MSYRTGMFTWIWIFGIVLLGVAAENRTSTARARPTPHNLTCETFENDAHFDPYQIIDSYWKIFYFWGETTEVNPIVFTVPTSKRLKKLKTIVKAVDPDIEIEWAKAEMLMEPRPGLMIVLLHANTTGAYRAVIIQQQRDKMRPVPGPLIKFADIRIKSVGRYIAMMSCEELSLYVMARVDEMPTTEKECETISAHVLSKKIDGRSFLYVEKQRRKYADEL